MVRSYQLDEGKDQWSPPLWSWDFKCSLNHFRNDWVSEIEQNELLVETFEHLSLFLSNPAEFRIYCPEAQSSLAAIDPCPNQTQDFLNM